MKDVIYEHENNNNYMIINSQISISEVSYQQKMLEKNSIDGLLDMTVKNINNNVKYYYNITSKQKMTQLYEVSKIEYSDIKAIIRSLSSALSQMKNYMLDIDSILLEPEYIYIDVGTHMAEFTYYPHESYDFASGLKILFEYILERYNHNSKKTELMQVYNIYQKIVQGQYDINNLMRLTEDDIRVISENDNKSVREDKMRNDECKSQDDNSAADNNISGNYIDKYDSIRADNIIIDAVKQEEVDSEHEVQDNYYKIINAVRIVFMVISAYMIITLFIKRLDFMQLGLYTTITIAILNAGISGYLGNVYKRHKVSGKIITDTIKKDYTVNSNSDILNNAHNESGYNNPEYNRHYDSGEDKGSDNEIIKKEDNINISNPSKENINMGNTVLLSDYIKTCTNPDDNSMLILKKDDEFIKIQEFPCIIGSMKEYCMEVIENRLISRMHMCILSKGDGIYVQDMNSTNGTYLNEVRLLPGEEKLIHNGDSIKLATDCYTVEIH